MSTIQGAGSWGRPAEFSITVSYWSVKIWKQSGEENLWTVFKCFLINCVKPKGNKIDIGYGDYQDCLYF